MLFENEKDALGQQFLDYLNRESGQGDCLGFIERYDGFIGDSGRNAVYFSEHKNWSPIEKKAIRFARGKVLDIGTGAGRHALYLQEKGLDVTGLDNSPLCLEVCRKRGVEKTALLSIEQIGPELGTFDTILMLGNNFGLFGSYKKAKKLLKTFYRITSKNARIIATSADQYDTTDPDHLTYQQYNRDHGRMSGQLKIRVRYRKMISPWFDYLMVSKEELEDILEGTGWKVARYIDSGGAKYAAIIEKTKTGGRR